MFKIVKREEMAEGTVILNEIEAPLIAKKAKPGQFVILKTQYLIPDDFARINLLVVKDFSDCTGPIPGFLETLGHRNGPWANHANIRRVVEDPR